MNTHPLIQDCTKVTGLSSTQVAGAIGLVLSKLQENIPQADFQKIKSSIPDVQNLIQQAPPTKKGFLGNLAGSVGGDKAKLLMEVSQGLSKLGIPTSEQKPLAKALSASVEKHYPELQPVFEKLAG